MENALQELLRQNPHLRIRHDAVGYDMYYMNFSDKKLINKGRVEEVRNLEGSGETQYELSAIDVPPFKMLIMLTRMSIQSSQTTDLFSLAGSCRTQKYVIRYRYMIFYARWTLSSLAADQCLRWYPTLCRCTSEWCKPFSQRNLLRNNIITEAESCLALPHPGASLRTWNNGYAVGLVCSI